MPSSALRALIGVYYSFESFYAQKAHSRCVSAWFTAQVQAKGEPDQKRCPSKLLPFRGVSTEPESLFSFLKRNQRVLLRQDGPPIALHEGNVVKILRRVTLSQLGFLFLAVKFVVADEFSSKSKLVSTSVLSLLVMAMMSTAVLRTGHSQTSSFCKLFATLTMLSVSVILDYNSLDSSVLLDFTLLDLVLCQLSLLLFNTCHQMCAAIQMHQLQTLKEIGVISNLASTLFADDASSDEVTTGNAIVRIDGDGPPCLLSYNQKLKTIMKQSVGDPTADAGEDQAFDQQISTLLLQDLTMSTWCEGKPPSRESLGTVLATEFSRWTTLHRPSNEEREETLKKPLLQKVFRCNQPVASTLENSDTTFQVQFDLEVVVHVLNREEPLFLLKVTKIFRCDLAFEKGASSQRKQEEMTVENNLSFDCEESQTIHSPAIEFSSLVTKKQKRKTSLAEKVIQIKPFHQEVVRLDRSRRQHIENLKVVTKDLQEPAQVEKQVEVHHGRKISVSHDKIAIESRKKPHFGHQGSLQPDKHVNLFAPLENVVTEVQEHMKNQCDSMPSRRVEVNRANKLSSQNLDSSLSDLRGDNTLRSSNHPSETDHNNAGQLYKMLEIAKQTKNDRVSASVDMALEEKSKKRKRSILAIPVQQSEPKKNRRVTKKSSSSKQLQASLFFTKVGNIFNLKNCQSPIQEPERRTSQESKQSSQRSEESKLQSKVVQGEAAQTLSRSEGHLASQIKNNEIFVYKIIHDLRHPTEFLANTLAQLSKDLELDLFSNDANLKMFDHNVYRYCARNRVKRALSYLKKMLKPRLSESWSEDPVRSRMSSSLAEQREQNLEKNKNQARPLRLLSLAEPQRQQLPDIIQINQIQEEEKQQQPPPDDLNRQKLLFERPAEEKPNSIQAQAEQRENRGPDIEPEIEEEKKEVPPPENDRGSHNESSIEGAEEDEVAEEGGLDLIEQISSAKKPQKKDFIRPEVQDLVQQRLREAGSENKYRTYSLAFERLMQTSEREKLLQIETSKVGLKNVLNVINQLKEESAKLSEARRSAMSPPMVCEPSQLKILDKSLQQPIVMHSGPEPRIDNLVQPIVGLNAIRPPRVSQSQSMGQFGGRLGKGPDKEQPLPASDQLGLESKAEQSVQRPDRERQLQQSLKILLEERDYFVFTMDKLLLTLSKMKFQMENLGAQSSMMLMLMRDLMNQAQLANNTFSMVNEYFDCIKLVKQCITVMMGQAKNKNVHLTGPVHEDPLDKYYFLQLYSDERRYGQCILNFLSNSIKFTPAGGHVTVLLNVMAVTSPDDDEVGKPVAEHVQHNQIDEENKVSRHLLFQDAAPDKQMGQEVKTAPSPEVKIVHFQMIFRDTGCGISVENQKKLFMNFGKLQENQESNKAGVGLGLSICREIILAQGGNVDIQSELGKGTEFIINLQARCIVDTDRLLRARARLELNGRASTVESQFQEEQKEAQEEPPSPSTNGLNSYGSESQEDSDGYRSPKFQFQPDSVVNLNRCNRAPLSVILERSRDSDINAQGKTGRCLLANDETFLLFAYKSVLEQHFREVDVAENGVQALEAVTSKPHTSHYDAILLDISMPIMDGMETCRKIKEYFGQEGGEDSVLNNSIVSFSAFSQKEAPRRQPLLYAITAETEEAELQLIKLAGFEAIYSSLDLRVIKEIRTKAGLPIIDPYERQRC